MTADLTISVLSDKLTLKQAMRIHFAGQAMAGLLATPYHWTRPSPEAVAKWSVQAADALIAELEKTEGEK